MYNLRFVAENVIIRRTAELQFILYRPFLKMQVTVDIVFIFQDIFDFRPVDLFFGFAMMSR